MVNGLRVTAPAMTWREMVVTTRPARKARMRAAPGCVVLKRRVTRNFVPERFTRGAPSEVRLADETVEKVAVTERARLMVTVHVRAVPLHAPPQPRNVPPAAGVAVSTTVEFGGTFAVQELPPLPQAMPPPLTVPLPVTETESKNVGAAVENAALTVFALVIETVQVVAVPLQAPPQPLNVAPEAGVAVRVTFALSVWLAVHVVAPLPQLIPPPVTVPGPETETVSAVFPLENVAVTLFDSLIKTVQVVAVPPQAPLQPVNVEVIAGVAVSVTVLFCVKVAEQAFPLLPQLIAPSPPLTLPLPLTVTVSWGDAANVAPTVLWSSIVTVQAGTVPEQDPLQPVNVKPASAVAVSVTEEFRG
jgi:hypothetical protein